MFRDALCALNVRRLVLAIHDQSFPSTPDENVGRGSPYGKGARDLWQFAGRLGFDGVQLGPQGDTALDNPSPYDGALFSKSAMSIALGTLTEDSEWATLGEGLLASLVNARPDGVSHRAQYGYAWHAARQTLRTLHARFVASRDRHPKLAGRFAEFRRLRDSSLELDGAYETLVAEHGTDDWRLWPRHEACDTDLVGSDSQDRGDGAGDAVDVVDRSLFCPPPGLVARADRRRAWLRRERATDLERHAFGQFILSEQHHKLRGILAAMSPPLALYGDFPIGFSHRDVWSRRSLFRSGYAMGAPPSRTNPDGQPWGFPVLDPEQYFSDAQRRTPGPVMDLLITRVDGMLAEFDGLRIDHPHGLVCPWVYFSDDPDPRAAVSRGARLFCSPNLSDHPLLMQLAIPTPDQLSVDPGIARYADDWVRELRDEQVAKYGVLFDAIMTRVATASRHGGDVVCEVLSTWPYPLRRVMERHGLGRFCVLQKADLMRQDDVYRAENAAERDWIMVGNHDTRPIWLLADMWHGTAAGLQWASYLADQLMPSAVTRARLARWLAADPRHLCHAMFAVVFASRARQVSVFFADLFGMRETYNRPGIVDPDNWTLRLPTDWQRLHEDRVQRLDALNIPLALALALTSPAEPSRRPLGAQFVAPLVANLVREAQAQTPTLDQEIISLIEVARAAA
jgi:4-alpha-glucanotransferase